MVHLVGLKYGDKWISAEWTPSDCADPLKFAMRYVLSEYQGQVTTHILASYEEGIYDVVMGSDMHKDFNRLMDDWDVMSNIGSGDGWDEFVRRWFPNAQGV
jgi:hypothetical protein